MSTPAKIWIAATALTFGVIAAAAFLPEHRLWGVNHLAFYPVWLRLAALGLIALSFVPAVSEGLYRALLAGVRKFRAGDRLAPWLLIAIAFGSVAAFNGCRSSTLLLGDGQYVSNTLELLYEEGKPGVVESMRQINTNEHIAPGTYTLNFLAGKVARTLRKQSATAGVRRLNTFLGACVVLMLGWVLLHAPMSDGLRVWLLVVAGTTGAMQLFFGYVENYTILFSLAVLYVVAAFSVLYRGARGWPLIPIVIVCTWVHIEGILLFPSLVVLFAWRRGRTTGRALTIWAIALAGLTLGGAMVLASLPSTAKFFLTVTGDHEYYGVFSVPHGLDLFNAMMILLPSFILFGVAAIWPAGPHETTPKKTKDPEPPAVLFVTMILVPCAIFLIGFKAEIGAARDWDLFAIAACGLVPAALLVVKRMNRIDASAPRRAMAPVLVMSLVLSGSWIGVNASPDRTPRRIEAILQYDSSLAPYAYETLAKHYHGQNRLTDAIEAIEKGAALSKNPRHQLMLANLYHEYGDNGSAERLLGRIVRNHPDNVDARRNLCILMYEQKRFEELIEIGVPGVQQNPSDLGFHYMLGRAMLEMGRLDDCRTLLQRLLLLNPPANMQQEVEATLRHLDELQK